MFNLHVELTDEEREHLKKQTEATGLTTAAYVRRLLTGAEVNARPPEIYAKILRQLSALGNNINQIAKVANSCGRVRQEDIDYIIERQSRLWDMIRSL